MSLKKILFKFSLILIVFSTLTSKSFSLEPKDFVQSVADQASLVLTENFTKEQKIEKLKSIAKDTVDIIGIGYYSLGKHSKNLDEEQKKKYLELFEKYFLKSFTSRLTDYSDPKIDVIGTEVLNPKYTIVKSVLLATDKKPEVKIEWRVYTKNPDKPLIRDLIIEGLSLARTQKEEFASVIESNSGDVTKLFETLKEFVSK